MTPKSVREYAEALRPRYLAARRGEKGRMLTEFCRVTGYHRDSAIRLLGHPAPAGSARRGRRRSYGLEVKEALRKLWEAADRACGKRLKPFVPTLLEAMEAHGEIAVSARVRLKLLALSSATIDRLLKPYRQPALRRPLVRSGSVSAIRALVPVRTFGEWQGVKPGSLQMDLVLHCGESTEGFYLTSLVAVDVATGWNERQAVWGKGKDRVGSAARKVAKGMPFAVHEMHTDNGGEFINDLLYPWCVREGIRLTRGRPYKKNDQAYVEQRNWTAVRRVVGYDRYATKAAYEALTAVYRPLRLYLNFFQPIRKLIGKERVGAKVVKRFDEAKTPYQRVVQSGVLDDEKRAELARLFASLNPVKLKREVDDALEMLWKLAERPGTATAAVSQGKKTA